MHDRLSIQGNGKLIDWNKVYSDHEPVICEILPKIEVLSWNILTKCRDNKHSINNGFNMHEVCNDHIDQYKERLGRIAAKIGEFNKDPKLKIIALQEVPAKDPYKQFFFDYLTQHLNSEWEVSNDLFNYTFGINRKGEPIKGNFGKLIIYRKSSFAKVLNITDTINLTHPQKYRIQLVSFKNNNQDFRYGNVHLFPRYNISKLIQYILDHPIETVIGGDFNCELTSICNELSKKEIIKDYQLSKYGFSYWNPKTMQLNPEKIIDGFISNFNLAL